MQGTWCQSSPFTTTSQAGFLETLWPLPMSLTSLSSAGIFCNVPTLQAPSQGSCSGLFPGGGVRISWHWAGTRCTEAGVLAA